MASVQVVLSYAEKQFPNFVEELQDFVRFPSIGTDDQYKKETAACANWLAKHLEYIGLQQVKIFSTPRHPIVYGEWLKQPGKPTLLIYGHYDVQPVEPVAEWSFPPFKPFVQGDYIYGRGASDDKGQLFANVKALEAFLKTYKQLPVNIKCLFDGEEEMGSPSLANFIQTHQNLLKANVAVLSDMAMLSAEQPSLTYALRGSLSVELEVKSQAVDLHSGNFGGAVHNPLQVVSEIIAKLHDQNGRITIPGFYDQVKTYTSAERNYMRHFGPTDKKILEDAQAYNGWGEKGFTAYERTTIRPALSVNGIVGGYQGTGVKSVIPAKAGAKLNFRIAPNQDPYVVEKLFRKYMQEIAPPSVAVNIRAHLHAKPYELNIRDPALQAGKLAFQKVFGKEPVLTRIGGTIPAVSLFKEKLNISTILLGFGLPTDRIHAPNERFYLPNFKKGIKTSIWFMTALSQKANLSGSVVPRQLQKTSSFT
ncbi:succinyl-diaminopimelate desuccinylase [Adhaeribacter aerolatus]|uniref:Succinyl-diaminopimelate desuccinylase n=1 Tax=Adhaeribacter aerolatus TaxID=670289 RepID=A0A512B597_9BACT|nr:dipeptidase [Adhaeribacter aerolatus]GEO06947.1 succinyl-diaminopimelate desuccinylase [Adhaeribacter aerolatus]